MKMRKKKAAKALSILLTLLMILCTIPMTAMAETVEFSDTWDHWAKDSIERWSDYGIINGMPEGYFNPDGGMTRAQAASVFAKLLNLKPARPANFIDVPTYEWYVDPIARVVAAGIMNGMGDGLMNPEGFVSREQFFVMFARALGIHPQETTSGVPADGSDYSTGYINALTDRGFVKGDENGVNALADISRASVVALLDQTISTYANKEGATVKAAGSGVTLVVADGVTVTGKAEMLAVAVGAEGTKGITVKDAEINQMNVMADANVELAGDTKVEAVSVDISADGSKLTVDKNATVGTIDSEASNSTIDNKGTVTGTITTTGEKTDVSNSGSVASIDAKGKNTEVSNTGKVSGNITATGTVSNTGTITGNVAATGAVTNKGKVSGSIAQNGEATKPAESSSSGGGGGGGSSGGGGGSSSGGSTATGNIYTITVDSANIANGSVSVASSARDGSTVTLTLTPNANYKVNTVTVKDSSNNNLTVNGTGNTRTFTMPGKAVTVTATFVKIRSSVTVNSPVGGTVSANATSADAGDTVTVTATPDGDHNFGSITVSGDNGANISVSGSNGTYTFTMPPQAVTVAVSFVAKGTVATPTFSPVAGTYIGSQSVNISCSTDGATIHYTTDGSNPTTGSTVYNGAISVTSSTTIKAIAVKAGMTNSGVATAAYTITARTYTLGVAAPTFTNETYGYTQPTAAAITITSTGNSDATISSVALSGTDASRFTLNKTDGATITAGSTDSNTYTVRPNSGLAVGTYTATITVTYDGGATATAAVSFVVSTAGTVATPTFSPAAGAVESGATITIACATEGSTIHYTTDGAIPTVGSATYSSPIPVTAAQTIKAIAVKDGMSDSAVATAAYTIQTHTASVAAGIEHGTVTVSTGTAAAGTTITVTITPNYGYTIGSVTYNDGSNHEITESAGVYAFTMPAADATVSVAFENTVVSVINSFSYTAVTDEQFRTGDNYQVVHDNWYPTAAAVLNEYLNANFGITKITGNLAAQFLLIDKYGQAASITEYNGVEENEGTPAQKWTHEISQAEHSGAAATQEYFVKHRFNFAWAENAPDNTPIELYHYTGTALGVKVGTIIPDANAWATSKGRRSFAMHDQDSDANIQAAGDGDYAIVIGGYWYVFHWDSTNGITAVTTP